MAEQPKIMYGRWKFNQKLKNWTWLHMIVFSCRTMKKHVSFNSEMSFMRFGWNFIFAIRREKSVSHGIRWKEKKVLNLVEKFFVLRKHVRSLSFHTYKMFFSLEKLRRNGKSWKLKLNPLFSGKSQVKHSLLGSYHPLQS